MDRGIGYIGSPAEMSAQLFTAARLCDHAASGDSDIGAHDLVTEINRQMQEAARRFWGNSDTDREAALRLFAQFRAAAAFLESLGWSAERIREHLGPSREVFATSAFMRRCQQWPRGYAGDFETVEYLASGVNRSVAGTIGWNFEEILLQSPVVRQHCNKLSAQSAQIGRAVMASRAARVLSIACGGCLDWLPILPLFEDFSGEIVLNDCEPAALEVAEQRLRARTPRFRLAPGNVLRIVKRLVRGPRFDLVIAGGLFDYLPDSAIVFLLRTILHDLLAPGGTLLFTNIAEGNPWRTLMEYGANWTLIERSEAKLRDLCAAAGGMSSFAVSVEREPTGLTMIARVSMGKTISSLAADSTASIT